MASAAVDALFARRSLVLFATHYPTVAHQLAEKHPGEAVALNMAYLAEPMAGPEADAAAGAGAGAGRAAGGGSAPSAATDSLTFLYRVIPGVAPCSFGLNVARMAGIGGVILKRAEGLAKRLMQEHEAKAAKAAAARGLQQQQALLPAQDRIPEAAGAEPEPIAMALSEGEIRDLLEACHGPR